ncbi:MAG TPA: hypothetical protein VK574_11925 [Terracidiphilus sp.]|nr:hypothetical protein [Terracidiphilus sp.]
MNAVRPKLVAIEKKVTIVPKPKRKRGAAKMREAADKIVGRDCKPIVEALSSNCKKGQMLSAKFLYGLAQLAEASGEGESARKFRSIATEWANSPEWKSELEAETPAEEEEAD